MKQLLTIVVLTLVIAPVANADIWKWVDDKGKTHFVDSNRPIYTWVDEFGKRHYADSPAHEDAVSIELVWHSEGDLEEAEAGSATADSGYAYPGETAEERAERERAEQYYCKRATEVYESYINAPQLYKTDANGERQILSKEEMERTIADTLEKKKKFCNQ